MRIISAVLATAIVFTAGSALACRGETGYPEAQAALQQSTLDEATKQRLQAELDAGQAMHDQGHAEDNGGLLIDSLEILDRANEEINAN